MGLKKGKWSPDEDWKLVAYVKRYGIWNWNEMPKAAGLARSGKSTRLRWMNYLRPDIKHGNFNKEEEETIIRLHEMLGNKWSAIAARLPGRTDNDIKNYWNTYLKKRLRNTQTATDLQEVQTYRAEPNKMKKKKYISEGNNSVSTAPRIADAKSCNLVNGNDDKYKTLYFESSGADEQSFPMERLHLMDETHVEQTWLDGSIYSSVSFDDLFDNSPLRSDKNQATVELQNFGGQPFPLEGMCLDEDNYKASSNSQIWHDGEPFYENPELIEENVRLSSIFSGQAHSLPYPVLESRPSYYDRDQISEEIRCLLDQPREIFWED